MKGIIELRAESFARACDELAQKVVQEGRRPDVVLGIRTGGALVGERVAQALADAGHPVRYMVVTCRRPTTKWKQRIGLQVLLRRMPRWSVDMLRRIEAGFVGLGITRRNGSKAERRVEWGDAGDVSFLEQARGCEVLVVDDAVDSGATLAAVLDSVRALNAGLVLHTAAIVVTQEHAACMPDYVLYRQSLVRFPWSMDAAS